MFYNSSASHIMSDVAVFAIIALDWTLKMDGEHNLGTTLGQTLN